MTPKSQSGDELPPLWHWLYFLPTVRQSELAPDGHAKRGRFLPPVTLPRRMWAGRAVRVGRCHFEALGQNVIQSPNRSNAAAAR